MTDKLIVLWYYLRAKFRFRCMSRQRLLRWQRRRIRRHLRFVRRSSPFYRAHWGDLADKEWETFPKIDKSMMMSHFDTLNTAGIRLDDAMQIALKAEAERDFKPMMGDVTIGLSSGTSGNRGLFLVSRLERLSWAGTVTAKVLPRSLLHAERIAFFLRANSNLYGSVGSSKLTFEFYDLLDSLPTHIDRLNAYKPTLLVAPPSMLRLLARAMQDGTLQIAPSRVVSVAEVLDPLDRQAIEEAFAQPVHQIYQCTEGFLASTCAHGTLHLNEDVIAIQKEYLDRACRKFIPIITDFSRKTQPIVRYRLNDILTEAAEACSCGSPFTAIERIEGRCDDMLYLPAIAGQRGLMPLFPDFVSRAIIAALPEAEEYRVIQHGPDKLEIELQLTSASDRGDAERTVTDAIAELCQRSCCTMPTISFSPYSRMPAERKLRRVERRFSLEHSQAKAL